MLYADDTVVLYAADDIQVLERMMQEDLISLFNWLSHNRLTMNCEKTKYMLISSQPNRVSTVDLNLHINGIQINNTDSFRFLGLNIQNNLKWSLHIERILKRINSMSGVIHRIGSGVFPHVRIAIYHAHINSHITYLLAIWGPTATESQINKLQICQNSAIRRIFNVDYVINRLHSREILNKYGILNIRNAILLESATLHFKITNNCMRSDHQFESNVNTHDYHTRNRERIIMPAFRTNLGRNNVTRFSITAFNELSMEIQRSMNVKLFRKRAKEYLLGKQ